LQAFDSIKLRLFEFKETFDTGFEYPDFETLTSPFIIHITFYSKFAETFYPQLCLSNK